MRLFWAVRYPGMLVCVTLLHYYKRMCNTRNGLSKSHFLDLINVCSWRFGCLYLSVSYWQSVNK